MFKRFFSGSRSEGLNLHQNGGQPEPDLDIMILMGNLLSVQVPHNGQRRGLSGLLYRPEGCPHQMEKIGWIPATFSHKYTWLDFHRNWKWLQSKDRHCRWMAIGMSICLHWSQTLHNQAYRNISIESVQAGLPREKSRKLVCCLCC